MRQGPARRARSGVRRRADQRQPRYARGDRRGALRCGQGSSLGM